MSNILKVSAALAVLLGTMSCTKEGAALFQGNYSFKTSGTISVDVDGTRTDILGNETAIAESFNVDLTTEQGQMDIITSDAKEGGMVFTMNVLGGDVYASGATADGEELEIEPFERKVSVRVMDVTLSIPVTVSGTARRYADTVIFSLSYEGETEYASDNLNFTVTLSDSDVRCVAKLN